MIIRVQFKIKHKVPFDRAFHDKLVSVAKKLISKSYIEDILVHLDTFYIQYQENNPTAYFGAGVFIGDWLHAVFAQHITGVAGVSEVGMDQLQKEALAKAELIYEEYTENAMLGLTDDFFGAAGILPFDKTPHEFRHGTYISNTTAAV